MFSFPKTNLLQYILEARTMRTEPPSFSIPLLIPPALFALGAIGMMIAAQRAKDVASREQSTTGTVVSHEPRNHNRHGYKFAVSFFSWISQSASFGKGAPID